MRDGRDAATETEDERVEGRRKKMKGKKEVVVHEITVIRTRPDWLNREPEPLPGQST